MGGFCHSTVNDCLYYKLGVPVKNNVSKESVMFLLNYACDVLNNFVPEILANVSNGMNGRCNNSTFH